MGETSVNAMCIGDPFNLALWSFWLFLLILTIAVAVYLLAVRKRNPALFKKGKLILFILIGMILVVYLLGTLTMRQCLVFVNRLK